jgi:serine/threonine protein kinase
MVMVARMSTCDKRRLREVLAGDVTGQIEAEVADHLQVCESCRRDLELLAGGAEWWHDVRSFLSSADPAISHSTHVDSTSGGDDAATDGRSSPSFANWRKQLGFLAPSETPGSLGRLGPYEITDVIGRGGMGIVLKAFDPPLNRHVAIKVLAAEWAHSATARRRFAREAQAAAAVVHDHVVPIHFVGAGGDVPYLVMACIPGASLQERLDRTGPLELKEILRIGMQTAAGLAAAHAQGLVHRDIKPANILLENGIERVRITDFGLARAVDDVSQTQSGILAGTPQYMSPEQAAGEAVDHRADLFSLGSVLYAMCTGRSPFRAESTVAVLRRICDGHPRRLREVNPELPEWLIEIIDKLHEKRPEDRFQSAAEVADLLERHLAHVQQPRSAPQPARLHGRSFRVVSVLRGKGPRVAIAISLVMLVIAAVVVHGISNSSVSPNSDTQASVAQPQSETPELKSPVAKSPAPKSPSASDSASKSPPDSSDVPVNNPRRSQRVIDERSIEYEVARLTRFLEGLEAAFHPREATVDGKAAIVLDIENRLRALERDLGQSQGESPAY